MTRLFSILSLSVAILIGPGCGQDPVELPQLTSGLETSECGSWYPKPPEGAEYGVRGGDLFPCVVWEPARIGGENTYINLTERHLAVRYDSSDVVAMVVVVSAKNCSNCALLVRALKDRADDLDASGALMVAMARRVFMGSPAEADFEIDEAEFVLEEEGWPVERWHITNDIQHILDKSFDEATPWVVVVNLNTMEVVKADNTSFEPSADGAQALISLIETF